MKLTIAYFTNRKNPMWEWFFDSLASQMTLTELEETQIIVIDAHAWHPTFNYNAAKQYGACSYEATVPNIDRETELESVVNGRFAIVDHLPPKPCVWQGPFRQTSKDWFAASNARNTALIAAVGDYFVGVDDLSVLRPGWLDQVRYAMAHGDCVCGAYKKVLNLEVTLGHVTKYTENPSGVDSRWDRGSDTGIVPASGSWLFGCSFGLPTELAMKVNGFDEICDGQSAEDYDFGIRVERAGGRFFYNRNMLTFESEERHHLEPSLARKSVQVTTDRLPEGYTGNTMSDHVLLNRLNRETDRYLPLATPDLRKLKSDLFSTGFVPVPIKTAFDWRDGTPLSEL